MELKILNSTITWHDGSGGRGPGLALAVYDGFSWQRRLTLDRRPTLALDLAASWWRRLGGEAGHGGQHRRLDVEHLNVILTLDQPLLRL